MSTIDMPTPDTAGHPRIARVPYILLAVFLGWLGIHNFAAGYKVRAVVQLLLGTVGWLLVFPPLVAQVWAWIEAAVVTKDANGVPMSPGATAVAPSSAEHEKAFKHAA